MLNDLLACYWPDAEPKIVIVVRGNDEDGYLVKIANSDVITGAKTAFLKAFDPDEFNQRRHNYWSNEYLMRADWHKDQAG